MLTIPRSLARELRAVFRKLTPGRPPPSTAVELTTGRTGFRARCAAGEVWAEFRKPGAAADSAVVVPLEALADCEGGGDSPAQFLRLKDGRVEVRWSANGVSREETYDAPAAPTEFPEPPTNFAAADAALLSALAEAEMTTAKEPSRYATDRVLARGPAGEVVGSDGKQLLVISGLRLPWAGDVSLPRSGVYAALAGVDADKVAAAKVGTRLWLRAGGWTVGLHAEAKSRYPDVATVIPPATRVGACELRLDASDAARLAKALPSMPGAGDAFRPVTLDLNGRAAVRAKSGAGRPSELVLGKSRVEGPAARLAIDRAYLARALRLKFASVQVCGDDRPVVCRDAGRIYVWMPLEADGVVPPCAEASPVEPVLDAEPVESARKDRKREVRRDRESPAVSPADIVAEAASLHAAARELAVRAKRLAATARSQRRQRRAVEATLASLRQLQDAGG